MKEAYYFSHDSNARNDGRILNLRIKHGMRGYGIFWSIIEMLRDENSYKMRLECERIAFELHEDSEVIKSVINDFDLFKIKDGLFWSESLLRRMKLKDEKSNKARQSALKRWNKVSESEGNANALQSDSDSNARKGKERKVNNNNDSQRSFRVDANKDVKEYRKYLFDLIKNKAISRDQLFYKCKIDLSRRNELWEAFILNSIENVPLIEDDKHGWNTFKKFINDNHKDWQVKAKSNFSGW